MRPGSDMGTKCENWSIGGGSWNQTNRAYDCFIVVERGCARVCRGQSGQGGVRARAGRTGIRARHDGVRAIGHTLKEAEVTGRDTE